MRISHLNLLHFFPPFVTSSSSSLSLLLRPLFSLRTLASNAMATPPNSVIAGDDLKFGFRRPEMYSSSLLGTVDPPYDRHVFLCYGSPESWPSRVEDAESGTLPKLLVSALKSRKNEISTKTRLTICGEGGMFSEGDVLIFPEMIKYRGLEDSNVDGFVDDVIVNGKPWAAGLQEVLTGSHVFVCAHVNRDKRCGVCGLALIEKFSKDIEVKGLKDQVFVSPCSHIGGHKYAGNLIIFSPSPEGKIMGHWYGYVTPDDVTELLDHHIGEGEIIERLWRGQMGSTPKDSVNVSEEKLPNGKELSGSKQKLDKGITQETGCCQGVDGVSCCRAQNPGMPEEKGTGGLSMFLGSWEQADVLAAVAVVGAVATVAVACGLYKKSG